MTKKFVMFKHNLKKAIAESISESTGLSAKKLMEVISVDAFAEDEYATYCENVKVMGEDGAIAYSVSTWEDEMA